MSALRTLLALVGLAPAGQVRDLSDRAQKAEQRSGDFKQQTAEAREEIQRWKAKAGELTDRLAKAEDVVQRLPKVEREMQQWKARDEKHLAQLQEVRERMERAERAIVFSREHLMATETKLDIIEGAIAVLDARTRAALDATKPSGE